MVNKRNDKRFVATPKASMTLITVFFSNKDRKANSSICSRVAGYSSVEGGFSSATLSVYISIYLVGRGPKCTYCIQIKDVMFLEAKVIDDHSFLPSQYLCSHLLDHAFLKVCRAYIIRRASSQRDDKTVERKVSPAPR